MPACLAAPAPWLAMAIAVLYAACCLGIVATAFWRLERMNRHTARRARVAFVTLFAGSLVAAAGVLLEGDAPNWHDLALAAGVLAVQVVSAPMWRRGVPPEYRSSPADAGPSIPPGMEGAKR